VLLNVRERVEIEGIPEIRTHLDRARSALDGRGRLVVRYSGTVPLLREMAEGPDEAEVRSLAQAIVAAESARLGT
jgi:phosphoglucosamine mutase